MNLDRFTQELWYEDKHRTIGWVLLPLSWIFGALVRIRLWAYRGGHFSSTRISRPVIVVGNLTVGGTGKTPFVVWLAHELQRQGLRAAIICRGYGGTQSDQVTVVRASSDPSLVGDEAALLAQLYDGLVIAGRDRVAAARLAAQLQADVVISDDGLQHFRLARDCSILVLDAVRRFGNDRLLPAGPLREPKSRATEVDIVVATIKQASISNHLEGVTARMNVSKAVSLISKEQRPLRSFAQEKVHVVTAIGNPQSFVGMLESHGIHVDARFLPDHATIQRSDLQFADEAPVLMTEKDAVKCMAFADRRLWRVPLELEMSATDREHVLSIIQRAIANFR